jgi:hypothetical protein
VLRVFDEISFRENFAKLATKRFSCFAKIKDEFRELRDEFREFRSFAKLPRLQKKRVSRNTKIGKTKKTRSKNKKFNFFLLILVPDMRSRILEVVVVRLIYWEFGVGREWERVEKGEVSLRVT